MNVRAQIVVPEPNTWREIVDAIAALPERRIAVQEYGRPNLEMNAALECLGACVTPIAIYRWQFPSDLAPLQAAQRLATHQFDVVLFTSAIQLEHLWEVVRDLGMEEDVRLALREEVVMTASLEAQGLTADIVPKHPKMAALVRAASDLSAAVLARKREARS